MAEAFNSGSTPTSATSLFKAKLVRHRGPWHDIGHLEFAVAEYIDWYNHHRLHGQIGHVPPVEFETGNYTTHPKPATTRERVTTSL